MSDNDGGGDYVGCARTRILYFCLSIFRFDFAFRRARERERERRRRRNPSWPLSVPVAGHSCPQLPCLPSPLLRPVTLWHLVSHLVIGLAAVVAVAADEAAARRRRDVRLRLLLFYVLFFVFCTNFCKNLLKCARYTHATLVPGKREQQQQHTHTRTPRIVLGCPCTERDTKIQRYDAHTLQLYTVIPKDIPTYIDIYMCMCVNVCLYRYVYVQSFAS